MNIEKQYLIPFKGLRLGSHTFEFEIDDRCFDAFEGSEIHRGHLNVNVELEKQSNGLLLTVSIRGGVVVTCDRCLDEFEMPVDYTGNLVVRFSETETDYDGDVMWINPAEGEFSLAQYLYESIWLSLPYQKVHPLDASGQPTCDPDMLSRFRIVSEDEFDRLTSTTERHADSEGWERLAQLKEQMEKETTKQ